MKIRRATQRNSANLIEAQRHLSHARYFAIEADCPKLTAKIRSAIKSAGGAERHMQHRLNRT